MASEIQRAKTEYKGYWQSGYGRGFKKGAAVYEINGKLYAKDKKGSEEIWPSKRDSIVEQGYVPVNLEPVYGKCYEADLVSGHIKYDPIDKPLIQSMSAK